MVLLKDKNLMKKQTDPNEIVKQISKSMPPSSLSDKSFSTRHDWLTDDSFIDNNDSLVKMSYGCFNMNKLRNIVNKKSVNNKNPFEKFYSSKKKTKLENEKLASNIYFDVYKFIHKQHVRTNSDPVEEINNLYKSLGLEDESLLDRAHARDYKLYGAINEKQYADVKTHGNQQYYKNQISQPHQRKSLYSRRSAIPDAICDDMALRNKRVYNGVNYLNENTNQKQIDYYYSNQPSPTTADYLRTRTKKRTATSLYNVVVKSAQDAELRQILYDDMAYRKLRKDMDIVKLSLRSNSFHFNGRNKIIQV